MALLALTVPRDHAANQQF